MPTIILAQDQQNILVQLKEKAQLTLPYRIREVLGIKKGDYLEAAIKGNAIMLTPKMIVNKMSNIVLSQKGARMMREALNDVSEGRVKKFDNVDDLIKGLHN